MEGKDYNLLKGTNLTPQAKGRPKGSLDKVPRKETPESQNRKFLEHALAVRQMGKVDLKDAYAVKERTEEYFQMCLEEDLKPTLSGYAASLGCTTAQLYDIRNDLSHVDTKEAEIIKGAYQLLEQLWEDYMLNGKVNPVSGIFMAKNQFSDMYRDSKEVIVKHDNTPAESPEAIKERYLKEVSIEAEVINDEHKK